MTKKVDVAGLIALLSVVCIASIASAQTRWTRTYGGTNTDEGDAVQQTTDGGYIVAGYTTSYGNGGDDVYLIKTNGLGDTLWTRTFGGDSNDVAYSVEQTSDGGYIVAGYTKSFGAGGEDVYLVKTNGQGDTLWTRTFGGGSNDVAYSVEQTRDSTYIMAGTTNSFGAGSNDVYLIRTNARGETLWTRAYGGTSADEGCSVQQTFDGGFVVAGTTQPAHGTQSFYLIRTDSVGETLWTRTFVEHHPATGMCVQQTQDSGFVVAGYDVDIAGGNGAILVKYNATGDTVWTRYYLGVFSEFDWVRQTPDLGYIVADHTWSSGSGDDANLMRFNSSGDSQWTRTYGGNGTDIACSIQPTLDGGYVVAGYTNSFGAGGYDVYLIKTDVNGNAGIEEPLARHSANPTRFLVRPSPFTSVTRVPGHETEFFVLSDVTGRQVAVCKGDRIGEGLQPGIYFLSSVGLETGKTATATIIKAAF